MKSYKLSEVLEIYNGTKYDHLETGEFPLYGSGGLMSHVNDYLHDGEAVLLPRKGTLNNIMYVNEKFWTVDTMYYSTIKEGFSAYYVYAYLNLLDLAHLDSGSTLPSMTKAAYYNLEVSLPDYPKQQKIASVLSTLDEKIALNNQINSTLEQMAKTLYDYWFVQFDFPDDNGKPYKSSGGEMVYNETLKRDIPKGWEVKKLSEIANITMGQSPDGASYNEKAEGTIFFQGSTDFNWRFPTIRQYTTQPSRFAKKGDILLSVRAPVGDMNIAPFDCCIGRGVASLNSKTGSDGFLFYVMKYFEKVFNRRNSEGTTFGSITKDDLHTLQVVVPSDEILAKFDAIVLNQSNLIFDKSDENNQLTKLRDWLLPMLMNGQVTVQ